MNKLRGEVKMSATIENALDKSVKRIALYKDPVELVNNMYGCHPDGKGSDYFSRVYKNL